MPRLVEMPPVRLEVFDPTDCKPRELEVRARQIDCFTRHEIWPYYTRPKNEGGLNLEYIDEAPYTLDDRIRLLRDSGPQFESVPTHHYVFGYEQNRTGEVLTKGDSALRALGVMTVGACQNEHEPVVINEINVATNVRRKGLGQQLMATMLGLAHEEDTVVQLDAIASNWPAIGFYRKLGITADPQTRLTQSEVFKMTKQRFTGDIRDVKNTLRAG